MLKIGSVYMYKPKGKKYDQKRSQSRLISQLKKCNKTQITQQITKSLSLIILFAKTEGGKMLSYMLVRINSTVEKRKTPLLHC